MREIGSEFWDVPVSMDNKENNIFTESTRWFLSGRSALQAVINEIKSGSKKHHTVAMPSWCCDSMVKPFVDAGIEVCFYPVYFDGQVLVQEIVYDCDILFLMDYFGYTGETPDLSGYNGVIVRDVTHSIFSATYADADYYFGSLRKWCGVWTGGYAWTKDGHVINTRSSVKSNSGDSSYTELRKKAMQIKDSYINGDVNADKSYLNTFNEAEDMLEVAGIVDAAERDVEVASKLDIDFIRTVRRNNAEVLREAFSECLIFRDLDYCDCPMFVPILVPDGKRNELRRHLINNEIYCPVHWPVSGYHTGEYHMGENHVDKNQGCKNHTGKNAVDSRTGYIYANELSLVCDQRYTEEDMNRVVKTIKDFMREA